MEAFDTFPFLKASQGYFQAWKVQVSEFVYFKEMKNACLFAPSKKNYNSQEVWMTEK